MSGEAEAERMISEAKLDAAALKPSPAEIRQTIADEAWRLESTQRALLVGGLRSAPCVDVMRRIAILDAGVRFLDACIHQPAEVARRLTGTRR